MYLSKQMTEQLTRSEGNLLENGIVSNKRENFTKLQSRMVSPKKTVVACT